MKIKINNIPWTVNFVHTGDIDNCIGVTKFRELSIYVATNVEKDVVRTSITHELIHAYVDSYGFILSDDDKFSGEQLADFIAMNLSNINELTMKIYLKYKQEYNIK